MRTTRRSLIGMLGLGAAAAALAPATVQADDQIRTQIDAILARAHPSPWGPTYSTDDLNELCNVIDQARADGYNQGRLVEEARQESRALFASVERRLMTRREFEGILDA